MRRSGTALVALFTATMIAEVAWPGDESSRFDAAWKEATAQFDSDLRNNHYVGGSLYFVHDGLAIGTHHFGNQTLHPARRVDENTIYHWASITKTFTAIGVMQLEERGLLDLDDPLTKHLPVLHEAYNPFGSMSDVTIRHLLMHTSGLRGPTFPWGGSEDWHPHEPRHWSQWDAMLPYTKLEFAPGTSYAYSNPGTSLLGRIIEEITGDDIEVYIDKNILRPLGMYRSYFDITPWHLQPFRSDNFFVDGQQVTANGIDFDTGMTTGNGGLNGPVGDMVKYVNFLVGVEGESEDDPNLADLLSRATLQTMWEPFHTHEEFEQLTEYMGMSFFVIDERQGTETRRFIGHTGGQKAFQTFFYLDPASKSAAIMAVNSRSVSMERDLYNDTRLNLFQKVFPIFSED